MVLCLTLPNGHPDEVSPLLLAGSGPPLLATAAEVVSGLTTLDPLTREFYVDDGTPGTLAEQNGSIAFPFATVQQGVDALGLVGGGTLLIAPATYAENVAMPPLVPIDLVFDGSTGISLVTIASLSLNSGPVSLQGINITGNVVQAAVGNLRAERCVFAGTVEALDFNATNCVFVGLVSCRAFVGSVCTAGGLNASGALTIQACTFTGAVQSNLTGGTCRVNNSRFASTYTANINNTNTIARDCLFTGNASFGNADLTSCTFAGTVAATATLTARCCTIAGPVTANNANLTLTRLAASTTITLALATDFYSIAGVLPALTYASISLQQVACRITLSVVVPAVAAGAVGYVNTTLVGTDLEGMLNVTSCIICNPQSDLVAAGAGGGFINARFAAANSLRLAFVGPLAGGAANFTVGLI